MELLFDQINWKAKSVLLDQLLEQTELGRHEIEQGFEAEVMKLSTVQGSFVLKIWNKASRPNVEFQYRLLEALVERCTAVSRPIGWGINNNGESVLLTTYDGAQVQKVNKAKITRMALVLSGIHHACRNGLANVDLPSFDFTSYFFPGIDELAELSSILSELLIRFPVRQDSLIHGDFHLRNLVEDANRLTVIDWTNGQLGDARYDLAWALVLLKLYVSDRHADSFRIVYLKENLIPSEELEAFEAMAMIRWILLARSGGAPTAPIFLQRMEAFVKGNIHVKALNTSDIR